MARPIKQGMDYFPHDTDAVNDEKIEVLRTLYGNDGYAFYFILLERIYRTNNFKLDISEAETIQILAKKIMISEEKFKDILNTALKYECFDEKAYKQRQVLTSQGIKKRANVVIEKRILMREKYKAKRNLKELESKEKISEAETMEEIGEEMKEETTQSKEKKSKEKKNNKYNSSSAEQIPYESIKKLFNSICITLPKIRSITNARRRSVAARWKEHSNIEFFEELFEKVNESDFLSGRNGKWLRCCFDWIMKEKNMQKILEGNYDIKEITVQENKWNQIDS